jgi:hypothetical protein
MTFTGAHHDEWSITDAGSAALRQRGSGLMRKHDLLREHAEVLRDLLKEKRQHVVSTVQRDEYRAFFVVLWNDFTNAVVIVVPDKGHPLRTSRIIVQGDEDAVKGVRDIIQCAGLGEWLSDAWYCPHCGSVIARDDERRIVP